jgi:CRP-like cAMP-binding protein
MYSDPKARCDEFIEKGHSIFKVLSDKEKEMVKKNIKVSVYHRNEVIFKEGDKPSGLLCLADGEAKIYKEGIGGRDQIVRMAKSAGFIGYRALFAEENHNANAVALDYAIAFSLDKEMIQRLIRSNADFSFSIIKTFASELGTSYSRAVTLTQKHIRGRLAESLLFLEQNYGCNDDKTIKLCLSREDLANLSNMTTSNAIRTLSALANEGIIELDGRKIKIIDKEKLERISDMG